MDNSRVRRRLSWVLGTLAVLGILWVILSYDVPILFYPDLPYIPFFKRCFYVLLLAAVFCLYRIFRGPTAADRIIAVDILGILVIGVCSILGIPTGRGWYIDIGIAWALQSFIGMMALAKFLEGRDFDE